MRCQPQRPAGHPQDTLASIPDLKSKCATCIGHLKLRFGQSMRSWKRFWFTGIGVLSSFLGLGLRVHGETSRAARSDSSDPRFPTRPKSCPNAWWFCFSLGRVPELHVKPKQVRRREMEKEEQQREEEAPHREIPLDAHVFFAASSAPFDCVGLLPGITKQSLWKHYVAPH